MPKPIFRAGLEGSDAALTAIAVRRRRRESKPSSRFFLVAGATLLLACASSGGGQNLPPPVVACKPPPQTTRTLDPATKTQDIEKLLVTMHFDVLTTTTMNSYMSILKTSSPGLP